ncbi:hypothetical protein Agub_g8421, partial [Astrephomene gubernaculifera]
MATTAMATTPRARGNALFVAGDYAAAVASYSEGLVPPVSTDPDKDEVALLLCNRAAAYLELGNKAAAAADCRACLQLQPCSFKAHFRLARALLPSHPDAAPAIAAALALSSSSNGGSSPASSPSWTPAMLETYAAIQRASSAAAITRGNNTGGMTTNASRPQSQPPQHWQHQELCLPEDPNRLAAASNWSQVESALRQGATLVILRPGSYTTSTILPTGRGLPYTLMAVPVPAPPTPTPVPESASSTPTSTTIGSTTSSNHSASNTGFGAAVVPEAALVELKSTPVFGTHAIWATARQPPVTLIGMRLVGSGRAAAACVSDPEAELQLVHCRVEDYSEVGLLVVGGRARLEHCTFARLACQAVEVREGGELEAAWLHVSECRQGVSAYGGARRLVLKHCRILRCAREGVLAAGTYSNAATEIQETGYRPVSSKSQARATETAREWGKAHGTQLDALLVGCEIAHCRVFGISADSGASLVAQGCRLEGNDPYGVFVKGGTDATIVACQVLVADAVSQSEWWKHMAASHAAMGPGAAALSAGLGLQKQRQTGVQVGVNFGGCVNIVGNAFAGPQQLAIVEEMHDSRMVSAREKEMSRRMGMWSKPAVVEKNSFHAGIAVRTATAVAAAADKAAKAATKGTTRDRDGAASTAATSGASSQPSALLPSIDTLLQRLPAWLALEG